MKIRRYKTNLVIIKQECQLMCNAPSAQWHKHFYLYILLKPTYPLGYPNRPPQKMKMSRSNLKGLTLILLIALFVWSSSFENCSASQSYIPQQRHWNYAIFNVLEYGAKGNGYADDTKVNLIYKAFLLVHKISNGKQPINNILIIKTKNMCFFHILDIMVIYIVVS